MLNTWQKSITIILVSIEIIIFNMITQHNMPKIVFHKLLLFLDNNMFHNTVVVFFLLEIRLHRNITIPDTS